MAKVRKKLKDVLLDPLKDFDKPVKKSRQARLPGMEDSPIKDLEEAALEHSELASEVLAKRVELKAAKEKVATLMKSNGKKTYNRGGIRLKLKPGHDDVSIQVKRHDREETE